MQLQWLKDVAQKDVSFSIKQFNDKLLIDAPAHLAGEKISVVSDGIESKVAIFQLQGEMAKAALTASAPEKSFQINYGKEKYTVEFENGNGEIT